MENPTSFDLNQAIQRWRDRLANSPASRSGNLADRESRLRHSIVEAQAYGLPLEEAFLVAVKRVGSGSPESDLESVHAQGPWVNRIMWMLVGFQVWMILSVAYQTSVLAIWHLAGRLGQMYEGHGTITFALTAALMPLFIFAAIVFSGWKVFRHSKGGIRDAFESLSSRPVKLTLVLLTTAFCVIFLCNLFNWYCARHIYRHMAGEWGMRWISIFPLLSCAVCSALSIVLTRKHFMPSHLARVQTTFELNFAIQQWRENLALSPAFRGENLEELDSHLRDSIRELQARGLAAEEAFLIATKRIGSSEFLQTEFAKVNGASVWLDRIVWVLIGFQVWMIISPLHWAVEATVRYAAVEPVRVWPGYEEMVYTWSVRILPFLILAGLVAIVWKRVLSAKEKVRTWLTNLLHHPVTLATLLFAACLCIRLFTSIYEILCLPLVFSTNPPHFQWQFVYRPLLMLLPQYAIFAALTAVFTRKLLRANRA